MCPSDGRSREVAVTSNSVSVVDYGLANLYSVLRAFKEIGVDATVVSDPQAVLQSERLVIPGVGSFEACMNELRRRGLDDAVLGFIQTGRPVLGICVGMQILFGESLEFGVWHGLDHLPGQVRSIRELHQDHESLRVPHIGWSELLNPADQISAPHSVVEPAIAAAETLYFVHSFVAVPENRQHVVAECEYEGRRLCAAVCDKNVIGVQFHPERSGKAGLRLLERFLLC